MKKTLAIVVTCGVVLGTGAAGGANGDDSAICAIVNVKRNSAQWIVGAGTYHGHATYKDNGDQLTWTSKKPVPVLVKRLATGYYGTGKVRVKCLKA